MCKLNAQNTNSETVNSNTIIETKKTVSKHVIVLNTTITKTTNGYQWGPVGFRSDSIVRMGKDFSTIIFCVKELPRKARNIS